MTLILKTTSNMKTSSKRKTTLKMKMTLNDDSLNNENNIKIKKISYWRQYSAWFYTTLDFLVNSWLTIACYRRFEFRVRPPEILMSLFCVFLTTLFAYSLDNFEYLRIRMFDVVSVQPSYQWTMYTLFYALINIIAWSLLQLGPINICVFSSPCSEYLLDHVLCKCSPGENLAEGRMFVIYRWQELEDRGAG